MLLLCLPSRAWADVGMWPRMTNLQSPPCHPCLCQSACHLSSSISLLNISSVNCVRTTITKGIGVEKSKKKGGSFAPNEIWGWQKRGYIYKCHGIWSFLWTWSEEIIIFTPWILSQSLRVSLDFQSQSTNQPDDPQSKATSAFYSTRIARKNPFLDRRWAGYASRLRICCTDPRWEFLGSRDTLYSPLCSDSRPLFSRKSKAGKTNDNRRAEQVIGQEQGAIGGCDTSASELLIPNVTQRYYRSESQDSHTI